MKLRLWIWVVPVFTILLSQLTLLPKTVLAATPDQGINLQISPLPIEFNTKPGSSVSADLRVRNAGAQAETLQVKLLKVTEDDDGIIHFSDPKPTDEWANWVSFSRTVFNAPPNEWQTIKMNVNLPKSAAFGYYFAVEYLRATPELPQPGKQVAKGAVATFILLNADTPGATREAKVVSFIADRQLYEFLPAGFQVKIRSTGNVHVSPHGNVFITKGGKQVASVGINLAEGSILPNSSRFFTTSWNDGFPHYELKTSNDQPVLDKQGKPAKSLKWDFSKVNRLRFGHYTANLVMVYDNGQRDVLLQSSVRFWVVPWRVVLYGIAIPIVPALLVYLIMKRRFNKRSNVGKNHGKNK